VEPSAAWQQQQEWSGYSEADVAYSLLSREAGAFGRG